MIKIIKILFIPCVLFLIVCFNFINVYASESNECSIIFDDSDNYSDFRNKVNGSTNVYILVKIKDSDFNNIVETIDRDFDIDLLQYGHSK